MAIKNALCIHSLCCDCSFHTNPCLEIPSRSWSAFVVNFKSLSITSSCRLVLLVSNVGGGLPRVMGCVTWADKGLLLVFTPGLPNVVELFTAEVWEQRNFNTRVIYSQRSWLSKLRGHYWKRYCNGHWVSNFRLRTANILAVCTPCRNVQLLGSAMNDK